jgi:hypothetical protein
MTAVYPAPESFVPTMEPLMTEESARAILNMRMPQEVQDRISVIAHRCREGLLSEEEHRDYKLYADQVSFLSLLQAQARLLLKKAGKL